MSETHETATTTRRGHGGGVCFPLCQQQFHSTFTHLSITVVVSRLRFAFVVVVVARRSSLVSHHLPSAAVAVVSVLSCSLRPARVRVVCCQQIITHFCVVCVFVVSRRTTPFAKQPSHLQQHTKIVCSRHHAAQKRIHHSLCRFVPLQRVHTISLVSWIATSGTCNVTIYIYHTYMHSSPITSHIHNTLSFWRLRDCGAILSAMRICMRRICCARILRARDSRRRRVLFGIDFALMCLYIDICICLYIYSCVCICTRACT